jgi:hypothetical protein
LPNITTLELVNSNAVFNADEYEFNASTEVFKLAVVLLILVIDTFTLAEVTSIFVNLPNVEELNEFKFVTEILTLADVDSKLVNLSPCESFVVLAADADAIKLPLTTPISVNLVSADCVNKF